MITQNYIDGLTRQVFIRDYILNGMFPCQSDIVRSIRTKKKEWTFADRFEYRMLLATTNTGGTLNSQVFNRDVSLLKPNELTYGIFRATYGTVSDGFDVDMAVNLETSSAKASFISDYAMKVHSMRVNVASLFKNFAINGRFGVVHRISAANVNSVAGIDTQAAGTPFTLDVPINVFASGFKMGKYLIKTTGVGGNSPWGPANVNELYMILDNQPKRLTVMRVDGATATAWNAGEFLEVAGNRAFSPGGSLVWNGDTITASGTYTTGATAVTGAMEGLADLFPWHVDTANNRLGLDMPFRDQTNRQRFSTEQAGGFYVRRQGESIIDSIMAAVAMTAATVPHANIGVWMNPDTMIAMGYQEHDQVRLIKELAQASPLIFQRGVTSHTYSIGSKIIPNTLEDHNLPTNIVVIGPMDDLSYNCWDNSMYRIDEYIHELWAKTEPPKAEDISVPNDFVAKLDLANRITYGAPILQDGKTYLGFTHPSNVLPIAFHEMGALFTEVPYAYTVINLRNEIINPADAANWTD